MSYTMEDFRRDYALEQLKKLSPEQLREILAALPAETRVAGLSPDALLGALSEEQVRQLADKLTVRGPARPRKPQRKR